MCSLTLRQRSIGNGYSAREDEKVEPREYIADGGNGDEGVRHTRSHKGSRLP